MPNPSSDKLFGEKFIEAYSQNTSDIKTEIDLSMFTIPDSPLMVKSQIFLLYVYMVGLLYVSGALGLIPVPSGFMVGMYLYTCIMSIEFARISEDSVLLLCYCTSLPFSLLFFIAREVSALLCCVWWTVITLILLQNAESAKLKNGIIFAGFYAVLYCILRFAISPYVFTEANGQYTHYTFLPLTDVSASTQFLETFCFCMIGIGMIPLNLFIEGFNLALISREKKLKRLKRANKELQKQIVIYRPADLINLDAPINKVIIMLRQMANDQDLDVYMVDKINSVIEIVASNDLFLPVFTEDKLAAVDAEVKNYLQGMVTERKSGSETSDINRSHTPGDMEGAIIEPKRPFGSNSNFTISISIPVYKYLMSYVDLWSFDVFALSDLCEEPLVEIATFLFEKYNFFTLLDIDRMVFRRFIARVHAGYKDNPYHNNLHASDVTQTVNALINMHKMSEILTAEDCFVLLISACIHDLDHPGVNNNYLIQKRDPLALKYNDQSVLENHHVATAFNMIFGIDESTVVDYRLANLHAVQHHDMGPDANNSYNILANTSKETFKKLRSSIIQTVLATDMAKHFEFIGKFRNKISGNGFDLEEQKDRQLIMNICIKCADISNPAKESSLSLRWTSMIMEEFFQQGDLEKANGLPVSTFMDRNDTNVPKCQTGFIEFIVLPLFDAWDSYMVVEGEQHTALENIRSNREHWQA